jgi:dihydrofolate synthase/folylpolyglutamate synthase
VGFDHRDWLGDTLEAIGAEKAGIFRAGRPVVLGSPQMPASVYTAIETLHTPALVAERDFSWEVASGHWSYRGPGLSLSELPAPPLAGAIQYRNAATAFAALEALREPGTLSRAHIAEAFGSVRLAGRFQILPGPVEWVLDVAHNEPAAVVLADSLRARPVRGRTRVVCGILRDKDAAAIGRALAAEIDEWILCPLPGARGGTAAELAERLGPQSAPYLLADSVAAACALARERAVPGDRVVVFGSFATVGAALEWLGLY